MSLWEYIGAGSGTTQLFLKMNNNATDDSWNSVSITATNVSFVREKIWWYSASFNWSSSGMTNSTFLDSWLANWTISCWIKTTQNVAGGTYSFIIYKTATGNIWPIHIWIDENEKIYLVASGWTTAGWPNIWRSTSSVNDWVWHNIICQWSLSWRSYLKCYIDWNLNWSITNTWGLDDSSIGADSSNDFYVWQDSVWARVFLWIIDELIVEWRYWSDSEIRKYYAYSQWRFANL